MFNAQRGSTDTQVHYFLTLIDKYQDCGSEFRTALAGSTGGE
jgi:hypothetical protein